MDKCWCGGTPPNNSGPIIIAAWKRAHARCTAAYVAGLKRARTIALTTISHDEVEDFYKATRAEIAAVEGGKEGA